MNAKSMVVINLAHCEFSYFCPVAGGALDAANKVWRGFDSQISAWREQGSPRVQAS
jgi:hypothetical protein